MGARRAQHNAWLCHRHGDASLNGSNGDRWWGPCGGRQEKQPSLTSRESGRIRLRNAARGPGCHSKRKESCLERACCLLDVCLSGVSRGWALCTAIHHRSSKGRLTDGLLGFFTFKNTQQQPFRKQKILSF